MWSAPGLGRQYDVEAVWRRRAPRFRCRAVGCGHFIAEERPHETVDELLSMLAQPPILTLGQPRDPPTRASSDVVQ